ncbi:MAG: NYN domain-containing protein [Candidatus Nealsonbacteria bacterium]|nr:NYN domain-containing protein [Candidatus Nealsonbacteria bacterium]
MDNSKRKERVAVYIDGSNFYGYLKDKEINFPKGIKFNFREFVNFLVSDKRELISKRYYTGVFRNIDGSQKSEELVRGQQKFFTNIQKDGFIIKRGKIMPFGNVYKEKGTDVKISVDLIVGAVDNLYDTAILVSSDTDLIPAICYIKYKKKKLEYVGFSHAPSLGIQKYANISRLLLPEDIEKFKEKTLV